MFRFGKGRKLDCQVATTIGKIEREHRLEVANGRLVPTVAFMRALASRLAELWRAPVTITEAWQIWIFKHAAIGTIYERFLPHAEIAHWYGINPFRLGEDQRLVLKSMLPVVQAQKALAEQRFDPTDYQAVYSLTLLATGDEQAALEARRVAMRALVEKESR